MLEYIFQEPQKNGFEYYFSIEEEEEYLVLDHKKSSKQKTQNKDIAMKMDFDHLL